METSSYYGKKGMLWLGIGVYVKSFTREALRQQVYCVWRLTSQLIIEKIKRKELDDEQAEEVESIMEEGVIEKDMVEELPLAG